MLAITVATALNRDEDTVPSNVLPAMKIAPPPSPTLGKPLFLPGRSILTTNTRWPRHDQRQNPGPHVGNGPETSPGNGATRAARGIGDAENRPVTGDRGAYSTLVGNRRNSR